MSASGGGDEVPFIPEKRELKYPNLGSKLDDIAVKAAEGQASAQEAADGATVRRENSVAVTVYLYGNVSDVAGFLEDNGGDPRNVGEDYIEAYVPVTLLGELSEQPGVLRVREIIPPETDQIRPITGHGPPVHGSQTWNQAGLSGRGVKVGVIDLPVGFNGFSELMGTELPPTVRARCYTEVGRFTSNLADCEDTESGAGHGTAVAESVMDIAPEVELYIAGPFSWGDLIEVVDWMVAEGVSVIVQSLSWSFDGPGDGTSPFRHSPMNAVDRAVNGGVAWVNAAGNYAEGTWFGGYSDADRDGWIEFDLIDETIGLQLEAEDRIRIQLRWQDAWGGASSNFDLYLYSFDPNPIIVKAAVDPQSGGPGHIPWEYLDYVVPRDGEYHLAVWHRGGGVPRWLQVMVWGGGSIEHHTQNGSITNPAESANLGMLAVGASHYWDTHTIADYSSRGPTVDGRLKPDIVGVACGETATYAVYSRDGYACWFAGTSQAAPHVAGLAALVRQRFPNYTPVQVANYLKSHAAQREAPDPNNTWGHGFALLPDIPTGCAAFVGGMESDCNTLLGLRDNLRGTASLNWSPNAWIGEWEGVIVGGSPPRVTGLTLVGKGLTGQIPSELGNLTELRRLSLWGNQLTGMIPSELEGLTNLETLDLRVNRLTGPIPPQLGNLTNLAELILGENELSGPIPSELASLTNLTALYLSHNQLTGPIPSEMASLTKLTALYLGHNQLTGSIPSEMASLTKLTGLWLGHNRLTGPIPSELGNLTNLTALYLSHNRLTGSIPPQLGNLTKLTALYLSHNRLTGSISPQLGNLTKLTGLWLGENQLSGSIPSALGRLSNLTVLNLGGNGLTDPIPSQLGSLTALTGLYLNDNELSGRIPTELGSLSNLTDLHLWGNQLSGSIPSELGNMTALTGLYLGANQLMGPIPDLNRLTALEYLNLGSNNLDVRWSTFESGGNLNLENGTVKLKGLNLESSGLTGAIPDWIASHHNELTWLNLSGNQLTGPIPLELGELTALTDLYLNDNQLTGSIPPELGRLTKLSRLVLRGNQLSGGIPPVLGSLSNLTVLSLGGNGLTRHIPSHLGSLTDLTELDLAGNQLSGQIPSQLGSVTKLTYLYLNDNQLTGCYLRT